MFSLLFPPGNERKSSIQQCQGQKLDLLIWLWQVCTLGIHNIIVHSGQTLTSVAHYLHTSDKAPALMNVFTKRFIVENNVPATYSLYVCIHYPIIVMKMYWDFWPWEKTTIIHSRLLLFHKKCHKIDQWKIKTFSSKQNCKSLTHRHFSITFV